MKKWLTAAGLTLALFTPSFAQDTQASPAASPNTEINVQAPSAPAPAPDIDVDVPAAPPSVSETRTTETNNTTVLDQTEPVSDNTGLMILGGVVGVLALGAILVVASRGSNA